MAAEETAHRAGTARIQRRTVATLSFAQVVGGVGVGSAISVGGILAEELSGSAAWAGTATTMITLGAALFALPLAAVAARRGRRRALSAGWLLAAAGGALVLVAAPLGFFPLFLFGMLLFGAGTAANLQSRYAAVDLAEDRTRGRDLSLVLWAVTVGSVAGPNLVTPGAEVALRLGLPEAAGPFVFATAAFTAAGVITAWALRPDPLLTARERAGAEAAPRAGAHRNPPLRASLALILASPRASLAAGAIALTHGAMIMVMTMTPVHMAHGGAALTVIGVTISLHIAGMYAFSPLVGWLADRWGRIPVLLAGQVLLVLSSVLSALAGPSGAVLTAGLFTLGLAWSFALVSASALLAESLERSARPGAQGASDMAMSLAGAGCGALSGVLLSGFGFGGVNAVAAALTVPVLLLTVRALRVGARG